MITMLNDALQLRTTTIDNSGEHSLGTMVYAGVSLAVAEDSGQSMIGFLSNAQ